MDPFLYLPVPSRLGDAGPLSSPLVRAAAEDFLRITPLAPSGGESYATLLSQTGQKLDALAASLDTYFAGLARAPVPTGLNDKQQEYDAHFHVVRAGGEAPDLLVAAAVAAFRRFFRDQGQGSSLLPLEASHLFAAAQLIAAMFGEGRK
jgi:hypothetical protein